MIRSQHTNRSKVSALFLVMLALPAATIAGTKYFEPADGIGPWNYAPYWDPAGVPIAGDTARIEAGGSGWTLTCQYINTTNPVLTAVYIGNLGTGTADARITQSQDALHAGYEYVGYRGTGKHFQSGGSVMVDQTLYLGRLSGSYGYYELSGGTLSATYPHIGYGGDGDFVQKGGTFTCTQLNISNANYAGPYGIGTYELQVGTLNAPIIYLGGKENGTFTQSGGTVNADGAGLTLGLDQYGAGHYWLSGGDLNTARTRLSWAGSTFSQTGGTHDVSGDLEVGYGTTVPDESLYTLSGTGALTIGDDLYLGQSGHTAPGRFRQTGGTTVVNDMLVLAEPTGTLQLEGGTFTCADVSNDGHYAQSGGTFSTDTWTNVYDFDHTGGILNVETFRNDSSQDMTIGGTADCRINNLDGNQGRLWLQAGTLRGKYIGGGLYFMCDFISAAGAHFQMDGGQFIGHLTNHGAFTYNGGTFAQSTFTNHAGYGLVSLNADLTCRRCVNNGTFDIPTGRWLNADGAGYANAVENNGNLSMQPSSHIDVGNKSKLVNNGPMYAGGPGQQYAHIFGDVENNDYLLPCHSSLPAGWLYINGDFAASSQAQLRIRIHGTGTDQQDYLAVQGHATLGGALDVRLTNNFVPKLGDSFNLVGFSTHTGQFNPVQLPTLPADRKWELKYGSMNVLLNVVSPQTVCPGDLNCDGQIDFADINPFVLALSNWEEWKRQYPDCPEENADVNKDGLYGGPNGFGDINPFVALLASGGGNPIPCP